MRIAIIAIGSRGDVQPFVALGGGLQRAGHAVRVLTHDLYAAMTAPLGLELRPLGGDIRAMVATAPQEGDSLLRRNPVAIYRENRRNARAMAALWMRECLEACRDVDAIIATGASFFLGVPVAERLGLPFVQAYTQPSTPTRAFPCPFLLRWRWRPPGLMNLLLHHTLRQLSWHSFRTAVNTARREVLGLPAWPFWGPWADLQQQRAPVLYAYSASVVPRPDDWPAEHHVVGYWFLDRPPTWQPPPALEAFLAAGPPPVCIGFGSTIPPDQHRMTELVVAALHKAGRRAVLVAGWGGLQRQRLPDSILSIDDAPFDWLLPRMAAIVHHGGGGTVSAGLRAGIPAVIVPFLSDQRFWALRLCQLGVAPPPIPYRELTAGRLAAAIERVTGDAEMARRAVALAAAISAEDGIGQAVSRIGRMLPTRSSGDSRRGAAGGAEAAPG
jgi:UDP:flavonoid glycosyltransferase YjiC (YdhE family)